MLKYHAMRLLAVVTPRVPRRVLYAIANLGGPVLYLFGRGAKAAAKANMRRVLGAEASAAQIDRAVRPMFVEAAKHYLELFRTPKLDLSRIEEVVEVDHYEYVERVMAKGRGLVIATAHCSNFDVLAQFLAAKGLGLTVPIEKLEPPKLLKLMTDLRAGRGLSFQPVGPTTMIALARVLRKGGVVAVTVDRAVNGTGRKVPFFGEETTMPVGAVELVRHTGAGLIVALAVRREDDKILGVVHPPIDLEFTGDRERDADRNLAKVLSLVEKHIRIYPEQWAVFDRVWTEEGANDRGSISAEAGGTGPLGRKA